MTGVVDILSVNRIEEPERPKVEAQPPPPPPADGPHCWNCVYYRRRPDQPTQGWCTRFPPVAVRPPTEGQRPRMGDHFDFATTDGGAFCGEYRPHPEWTAKRAAAETTK